MTDKLPPEVARKFGYYRRKIPEAFKRGCGVKAPDNIVDQLAYNLAINRCIEAGVFDESIKTPTGNWTLVSMILKELGDMKVHYESRFIAKFERKGRSKQSVFAILSILRANGWIQTKETGGDALVGRGSCVMLHGTYESFSLLFGLLKEEKGHRVLEGRNKKLDGQLKEARGLGLIRFKLRKMALGKYELEYELTDLGKYFKKIMESCEIDFDTD